MTVQSEFRIVARKPSFMAPPPRRGKDRKDQAGLQGKMLQHGCNTCTDSAELASAAGKHQTPRLLYG
jgi:hypothetical protein